MLHQICLYGSENWVLKKRDEQHIQTAEMIVFKSYSKVRHIDKIKENENIRKHFNITNFNDKIRK